MSLGPLLESIDLCDKDCTRVVVEVVVSVDTDVVDCVEHQHTAACVGMPPGERRHGGSESASEAVLVASHEPKTAPNC